MVRTGLAWCSIEHYSTSSLGYASPVSADKRLARRIKDLIAQRKTTAEKVAFEAEISKSYLSAVLRCQKSPTVRTLDKIAHALEVELRELF